MFWGHMADEQIDVLFLREDGQHTTLETRVAAYCTEKHTMSSRQIDDATPKDWEAPVIFYAPVDPIHVQTSKRIQGIRQHNGYSKIFVVCAPGLEKRIEAEKDIGYISPEATE